MKRCVTPFLTIIPCSDSNDHPSSRPCPPHRCRAERRSRMAEGHRPGATRSHAQPPRGRAWRGLRGLARSVLDRSEHGGTLPAWWDESLHRRPWIASKGLPLHSPSTQTTKRTGGPILSRGDAIRTPCLAYHLDPNIPEGVTGGGSASPSLRMLAGVPPGTLRFFTVARCTPC